MAGHSASEDARRGAYVPAIHVFSASRSKTWMPGIKPGMTADGPANLPVLQPLLQEGADACNGVAALRQDAGEVVPGMRHARPYLDFHLTPCRPQFVGHADRIVAQDLIAADVDQRGGQSGRIAIKR